MRYQFYREHKYVSAALNDVERLIVRTDFCDSDAVHKVAEAFDALSQMLQGHAQYENERLHALLEKKGSKVHIHATDDHAHQDNQLLEIQELIIKIGQASVNDKVQLGYQLYLIYRKFVADNLTHLHEEETQILPELQRLYSDEELRQVEAITYREMTPDQIIQMTETLFPHMNRSDQEAILADICQLEPEKFKTVYERIGQLSNRSG
jgi:hemerythrin-like domain-containing protein